MRNKLFHSLISPELTTLQKEQVELGRDHDLCEADIRLYSSSCYNFEQMRQIRLALEHKVDRKRLRAMCRPSLSARQMEEIRRKLEKGLRASSVQHILEKTAGGLAAGSAMFLASALFVPEARGDTWSLNAQEAILEQGEDFEPMQYVSCRKEDGTLLLPEKIDTGVPGSVMAEYRMVNGSRTERKYLRVTVKEKAQHDAGSYCAQDTGELTE